MCDDYGNVIEMFKSDAWIDYAIDGLRWDSYIVDEFF